MSALFGLAMLHRTEEEDSSYIAFHIITALAAISRRLISSSSETLSSAKSYYYHYRCGSPRGVLLIEVVSGCSCSSFESIFDSFFNSRKDMIKTTKMTPALIRKVVTPIELYNNPPNISRIILARLPKLLATPCTAL